MPKSKDSVVVCNLNPNFDGDSEQKEGLCGILTQLDCLNPDGNIIKEGNCQIYAESLEELAHIAKKLPD